MSPKLVILQDISFTSYTNLNILFPVKKVKELSLIKCVIKKTEKRRIPRKRHTQFFTILLTDSKDNFVHKILRFQEGSYTYPLNNFHPKTFPLNGQNNVQLKIESKHRYTDFENFRLLLVFNLQ